MIDTVGGAETPFEAEVSKAKRNNRLAYTGGNVSCVRFYRDFDTLLSTITEGKGMEYMKQKARAKNHLYVKNCPCLPFHTMKGKFAVPPEVQISGDHPSYIGDMRYHIMIKYLIAGIVHQLAFARSLRIRRKFVVEIASVVEMPHFEGRRHQERSLIQPQR